MSSEDRFYGEWNVHCKYPDTAARRDWYPEDSAKIMSGKQTRQFYMLTWTHNQTGKLKYYSVMGNHPKYGVVLVHYDENATGSEGVLDVCFVQHNATPGEWIMNHILFWSDDYPMIGPHLTWPQVERLLDTRECPPLVCPHDRSSEDKTESTGNNNEPYWQCRKPD